MSRPSLKLGPHLAKGVGAIALFVILAYLILQAPFGDIVGFPEGLNITASIGYAIVGLQDLAAHETESFLVALIAIAVVLDAAIDGAVMLARRDVGGQIAAALRTGGEEE